MIDVASLDPAKIPLIRITFLFEGQRYPECACGLKVIGDTLEADPSWLLPQEDRIPMEQIPLDSRFVERRDWPLVLFYALEVPLHSIPESSVRALADLLDQLSGKLGS